MKSKAQCVAAILLDKDGRALLAKRSPHKRSAPGYWSPIAGKIHPGESEEAAMIREIREEVGIEAEPLKKVASFDTRDGSATLHWWLVEAAEGTARICNDEHTELRWLDFGDFDNLAPTFAEDIALIRRAQAEWLVQSGPTVVLGTELVDTARFLSMYTPTLPVPEVNCVWRSILPDQGAQQEVERVVEKYRSKSLPLWWLLSPHSGPENLRDALRGCGLKKEFDAVALGLRTEALRIDAHPNITVEKVTAENSRRYWHVFGKEPNAALLEWTNKALRGEWGHVEFFFATCDGEPAGAAAHRIFGKTSFLMSGFTKPEFRHRGIYHELLRHRFSALGEQGVSWALTLSKAETSAPILRKLGFQEFGKYEMYRL